MIRGKLNDDIILKRFNWSEKIIERRKAADEILNHVRLSIEFCVNWYSDNMALLTKKGSILPEGGIAVSKEEALNYQIKFINNWPSEMDVLFLKYGGHMTAATTIASSSMILSFFKRNFKLNFSPYLLFAYLASSAIPSALSFIFTEKLLTHNVLLMKMDCPVCDELKFALSHLYFSVGYPAIFGYFSYGSRAILENTCYLPNVKTHPKEFWLETFSIYKKCSKVLKFAALSQSVWILFLPYMQNRQLFNVMNKVKEAAADEDLNKVSGLENDFY